jgi:hypothetical protein
MIGIHAIPGQVEGTANRKNSGKNQNAYQALSPLRKPVVEIAIVRIPNPTEIMPSNMIVVPM